MIRFKVTKTPNIKSSIEQAIVKHSEKLVKERLADILDEVQAEKGTFKITNSGSTMQIVPEGFSPELTAKILERFK